jgi:uncharacterized protein
MQFTLDARGDVNIVRAYATREVRVGERIVRSNCLIAAHILIDPWGPDSPGELAPEHLVAAFAARGVGLEAMTLGAACRTFNVLVQEERRVVAMLFLR